MEWCEKVRLTNELGLIAVDDEQGSYSVFGFLQDFLIQLLKERLHANVKLKQ